MCTNIASSNLGDHLAIDIIFSKQTEASYSDPIDGIWYYEELQVWQRQ